MAKKGVCLARCTGELHPDPSGGIRLYSEVLGLLLSGERSSYLEAILASPLVFAQKKLKYCFRCGMIDTSQIGYSQSASLLAHNLIAAITAFQWESALPLKQGSPNPPLSP